jgi:acetate kinase
MSANSHILTINSGSTSVKFALFNMDGAETRLFSGDLEGIEGGDSRFRVYDENKESLADRQVALPDHRAALKELFGWLTQKHPHRRVDAVGHRIVHGGAEFIRPHEITPDLLSSLHSLIPLAPDHLPHEIKAIQAVNHALPDVRQAACFDTAFHRSLPQKARMFALPRNLEREGVRRYGFHGLSCEYVLQELEKEAGTRAAKGRVIIAHLGGGASLTAVENGRSVDTTMGLTPLGGLVMGTRCGDLDPAVLAYLNREQGLSVQDLDSILNKESGLMGICGMNDMRDIHAAIHEGGEPAKRARLALDMACYRNRKYIGEYMAVLGSAGAVVFTAGIGENDTIVRQESLRGLEYLGIRLDPDKNAERAKGPRAVHAADSRVAVWVIPTDEELEIARQTRSVLNALSAPRQCPSPAEMPLPA